MGKAFLWVQFVSEKCVLSAKDKSWLVLVDGKWIFSSMKKHGGFRKHFFPKWVITPKTVFFSMKQRVHFILFWELRDMPAAGIALVFLNEICSQAPQKPARPGSLRLAAVHQQNCQRDGKLNHKVIQAASSSTANLIGLCGTSAPEGLHGSLIALLAVVLSQGFPDS